MFETWFAAAAESLRGKNNLPDDLPKPKDPEQEGLGKGWIKKHLPKKYKETIDQARFVGHLGVSSNYNFTAREYAGYSVCMHRMMISSQWSERRIRFADVSNRPECNIDHREEQSTAEVSRDPIPVIRPPTNRAVGIAISCGGARRRHALE